jgi:hypothetical protein
MIPKEDLKTTSVEAAEFYEQKRAKQEMNETDDFDWNEYFAKQNDEDECNCSDPHCPCGGNKRGY